MLDLPVLLMSQKIRLFLLNRGIFKGRNILIPMLRVLKPALEIKSVLLLTIKKKGIFIIKLRLAVKRLCSINPV